MNPRVVVALAVVAVSALGAIVLAAPGDDAEPSHPRRFEGAVLPAGLPVPDFTLTDQDGRPISMRALRGKPVIVTFLYTTCEDSCPTQAQQVKGALEELGEDVPAVAVAVDPLRDDPRSARAFLAEQRMTGRMSFVLGTQAQLAPVWRGFAVSPQREDLDHTARFVLVDAKGRQRVGFPLQEATPERIAHDLRLLMAGA